ncbi:dynein light intermediate chain 1, cytosolic [Sporothrix schenckii 1099-18]|uniref:Dynein light intermediate chain 1, cytosolic n=1 Tax=Sporothrix schenckii 1099-18 TaxID=1397361 RepID=A0A0F2M920_SPOSC|nr:dynein light intermediate chain 1, cytosolic [Sporothrix schenckii 1099-18]KJR86132.1 dynein light intermediate chain 1, cytosolic [Sporothrix schenckii 1099-18]
MANTNRFSTYTSVSAGSGNNASVSASAAGPDGTSGSAGKPKKDLWNSMLDSVASGRKLPERNLLVLGGTVDSQREFLTSLGDRRSSTNLGGGGDPTLPGGAPVANNFALGYTYYDVLDADQDGDILARISLYLLSKPSPAFSALLQPLLTPETIPNTLIVILLDWAQPWRWLRQLREWILLLRTVLVSLSPAAKEALEEVMEQWRERGRGGSRNLDGTTTASAAGTSGSGGGGSSSSGNGVGGGGSGDGGGDALPPGPGEWEDALGLPLCVVCQNAEKTDVLEKTQGWKDDEFDLVLQYLRTVLVKHGASLIYTTPNVPSQLPTLIHACLGVTSLLKRPPLKPEVIKRTEVVVPSNWDSWTKILVVREGFEVDKVSAGWSIDLQRPYPVVQAQAAGHANGTNAKNDASQQPGTRTRSPPLDDAPPPERDEYTLEGQGQGENGFANGSRSGDRPEPVGGADDDDDYEEDDEDHDSAVSQYERAIRDPGMDVLALAGGDLEADDEDDADDNETGTQKRRRRRRRQQLEVETEDVQLFLGDQLKLLEQLRQKDEAKRDKEAKESKRRDGSMGSGSGSNALANADDPAEVISSHIGPVQFNLGGIQVDADDMLERIKNRHGYGSASPEPGSPDGSAIGAGVAGGAAPGAGAGTGVDGASLAPENVDTEKMTAFFADLMNRPSQTRKS